MTEARDPKVSGAYRELAREEPPAAVDRTIAAAAREALEVRPAPLVAPTARRAWYVPLAAAAVIVLAVAITWHIQLEQPGVDGEDAPAQATARDAVAAAPSPAAAVPAGEAAAQRAEASSAAARKAATRPSAPVPHRDEQVGQRPPAAATPDAPRAPTGPATQPMPQSAEEAREQTQPHAQAARGREQADEPPEKWLERIAELRRAGRHEEADKALAEFRKRYPDYRVPESLLKPK
ncbi:MAG: hypothetical protein AB1773_13245 [Pseudomonadota bacterium]